MPVAWSISPKPPVDGLGALDGAPDGAAEGGPDVGLAPPEVQAATTTTRAETRVKRVRFGMADRRSPPRLGSIGRRDRQKGLDGARIFTAMSSGSPRPGPTRARTPVHARPRAVLTAPGRGPLLWHPEPRRVPERVYEDRSLTCRDCAEEFTFSAGEQAFYASKGLTNDPQRCPSCRAAAKRARSNEGPREFHAAICGACGGQAIVPFAPRNDRPVYCSSCFDKVRAGTLSVTAGV